MTLRRPALLVALLLIGCDESIENEIIAAASDDEVDVDRDGDGQVDDDDGGDLDPDEEADDAGDENFPDNGVPDPVIDRLRDRLEDADITAVPTAPAFEQALVDLGQALAFDKILSGNQDISCMTCHHPTLASADERSLPIGVGGEGLGMDREHPDDARIPRNSPALFNLHDIDQMFWDGRVALDPRGRLMTPAGADITADMRATLAPTGVVGAQAMFPVTSREEMRGEMGENELAAISDDDFSGIWEGLMERLGDIPEYVALFEEAYPGEDFEDMTFAHAGNAIGAFVITAFESSDSPLDAFLEGNDNALTAEQIAGGEAFLGPGRCAVCHNGPNLTDQRFHNTGMPQIGPGVGDGGNGNDDFGREAVSNNPNDRYAFRTTPLRNVALTAPYGHAGQFVDLGDFTAHYDNPRQAFRTYDERQLEEVLWGTQVDNENDVFDNLSPLMNGINLNGPQIEQIVAFMEAMTDPRAMDMDDLVPARVPSGLPVAD
ncbi:MAG: cytochrome c peroxidase [Myxococcota bacterium]